MGTSSPSFTFPINAVELEPLLAALFFGAHLVTSAPTLRHFHINVLS